MRAALGLEDVQKKRYEIIYCIARAQKSEMSEGGGKKRERKIQRKPLIENHGRQSSGHQTGLQH